MIRTGVFLSLVTGLCAALALLLLTGRHENTVWRGQGLAEQRQLVRALALTDLALWTEARYTRNPAMADFFTPFQDFPASFEHFPAGSIIAPSQPSVETRLQVHTHHQAAGAR